jgi:hypothetical protein
MARPIAGLSGRQRTFFAQVMKMQKPVLEVLADLKIELHVFWQWCAQEHFDKFWARVLHCLKRIAETDEIVVPRLLARVPPPAPSPTTAADDDDTSPPPVGPLLPSADPPEPLPERERIRRANGERAAQAYEDMVRRREARQAEDAAAAASTTAPATAAADSVALPPEAEVPHA